jgi:hypothetical protein
MQGFDHSGFTIGEYPIFFKTEIMDTRWEKIVRVNAFLPPEYPDTPLKQAFHGQVAELILTVREKTITVLLLRVFSSKRTFLLNRDRPNLQEIQSTKGLGKALLCYGIYHAWKYFSGFLGSLSDLIIDLETGATQFYTSSEWHTLVQQNQQNQQNQHLSKAELISRILSEYPNTETNGFNTLRRKKDSDLHELYVKHQENRRLADYYRHTYGFEAVEDPTLVDVEQPTIVMEVPATLLFHHCKLR